MEKLLQPHYRLLAAIVAAFIVSSIQQTYFLSIGLLSSLCLFLICRRKQLTTSILTILKLNIFVLFVWLTLPWKIESSGIVSSELGIHLATQISLKMNFILLLVSSLLTNLTDIDLAKAVKYYPLPDKFIKLFILTIRYIYLLRETKEQIEKAMKARGFKKRFNMKTFRILSQMVALLLINAMQRAEKSDMALKARCFYTAMPKKKNTPTKNYRVVMNTSISLAVIALIIFMVY